MQDLSKNNSSQVRGDELARVVRFLRKLRGLNSVLRWNYHPRVRQENVSEHSFWVAVLSFELGRIKRLSGQQMLELLVAALFHDKEESITSDIPALVKRGHSWEDVESVASAELGLEEQFPPVDLQLKRIIKFADLLAAFLYADEEVRMGNSFFQVIRGELVGSCYKLAADDQDMLSFLNTYKIYVGDFREQITDISHL